MDPIETQLTELVTEQKKFIAKADEEFKTLGQSKAETQTALEGIKVKIDEIQKQADAIDLKLNEARFTGEGHQEKSVGELFVESDEIKTQKSNGFLGLRGKEGRIRVGLPEFFPRAEKSVITTVGVGTGTTGVQMPFRLPGITGLPMQ
jgi:hypothetical protein